MFVIICSILFFDSANLLNTGKKIRKKGEYIKGSLFNIQIEMEEKKNKTKE